MKSFRTKKNLAVALSVLLVAAIVVLCIALRQKSDADVDPTLTLVCTPADADGVCTVDVELTGLPDGGHYEAASIDGASEWQIVKSIKLPELRGSLAITVIFSIIGSFQLFNEPSILQNMVPGNAITTYYTPNMYAYNLSFSGNQSNYAAALAIVMAVITMAIAYIVQLNSLKEQMK